MRSLVIAILVIVIILILVLINSGNAQKLEDNLQTCTIDPDCAIGQKCYITGKAKGYCVTPTCTAQDAKCGTAAPSPDCPVNSGCLDQTCVPSLCQNLGDCGTGQACVNGTCVITGETCNGTCYGGALKCVNGKCTQCETSSDCPSGSTCNNGICVSGCTGSLDCKTNYPDYYGTCISGTCQPCTTTNGNNNCSGPPPPGYTAWYCDAPDQNSNHYYCSGAGQG